jgi:hypothetical protein
MNYAERRIINGQILVTIIEIEEAKKGRGEEFTEAEKNALDLLRAAITDFSNESVDYSTAAEALNASGNDLNKVALLCYEIVMNDNPTIHDYQNCAQLLITECNFNSARRFLEDGLKDHEESFEVNGLLANIYVMLAQANLALDDKGSAIHYAIKAEAAAKEAHMQSGGKYEEFNRFTNTDYAEARNILILLNGSNIQNQKSIKVSDIPSRLTLSI